MFLQHVRAETLRATLNAHIEPDVLSTQALEEVVDSARLIDLFDKFINAGFIDTFREFETGPDHYSWWSYRAGARGKNIGWRIDYFLVSQALRPRLKKAFIQPEITGSDHCPVGIELKRK